MYIILIRDNVCIMKINRLVIEVSERFHSDIKQRAARESTTMKSYILNVLVDHLRRENESNVSTTSVVQRIVDAELPSGDVSSS